MTRASRKSTDGRHEDRPVAKDPVWPKISSALTSLTAVFALLLSGLTMRMTMDGQVTSRFSNAVDQLGSKEYATRTGAIYALARLARDSDYDRPVIISLLADYIRSKIGMQDVTVAECRAMDPPGPDVVAALRMLFFNIKRTWEDQRVDLREVCLKQIDFPYADLTCMRLDNVIIADHANFANANLHDTSLQFAQFRGTIFTNADFTRADATGARFGDLSTENPSAAMRNTILQEANFTDAVLVAVAFTKADFTRAKLTGADLDGSTFTNARLATHLGDAVNLPPEVDRSVSLPGPVPGPVAHCRGVTEPAP